MIVLAEQSHVALWGAAIGAIGALCAVVVGFFLNELSSALRARREDRRTIGRALAEILEVRHCFAIFPTVLREIRKLSPVPIPAEAELFFRKIFAALIPGLESLQTRYDEAVSSVAGSFPLLAYQLRSKDAVAPYLSRVRQALPAAAPFAEFWVKLEDQITQRGVAALDELVLELARKHSRKTLRVTRQAIKQEFELPQQFSDLVKGAIAQAQKTDEANGGQPTSEAANALKNLVTTLLGHMPPELERQIDSASTGTQATGVKMT